MSGYTQVESGIYLSDQPSSARRCCRGVNGLGIFGLVLSILGVFTFGMLSPLGMAVSLLALRRAPRGAALTGAVLGFLGTAVVATAVIGGAVFVDAAAKSNQTEVALQRAAVAVEQYQREHEALPGGIDGNKLLIAAELEDAWGESLRYEIEGKNAYTIRSAGPDGKFDTVDDLTSR